MCSTSNELDMDTFKVKSTDIHSDINTHINIKQLQKGLLCPCSVKLGEVNDHVD